MRAKIVEIKKDKKEIKLDKKDKSGKDTYTIGKKTWNREGLANKLEIGMEIEYEIKGPNFDFKRTISHLEKPKTSNNRSNRNNRNFSNKSSKMPLFSYPYNFVGLNLKKERKEYSKGVFSGKIKCTLKNLSPLFILGQEKTNGENEHPFQYFLHDGKDYIIPGSSIKGTIRNVFEATTGSCMKNIEGERLEERKTAGDFNDRVFGIIKELPTENEDGLIVEASIAKISHEKLKRYLNLPFRAPLKEGYYPIKLNQTIYNYESVKEIHSLEEVSSNGDIQGVIFVGGQIFNKKREKILFPKKNGKTFKLSLNEYNDFKYIIDQRKEREEKNGKTFNFDYPKVNNAVIFLEKNGNAISLAFSEIPRLRYESSPYELLDDQYKGCKDKSHVCLACRTFGLTGNDKEAQNLTDEEKDNINAQGKIFFTDARANKKDVEKIDGIQSEAKLIKSLGEPHPTQKAFYLENSNKSDSYNKKNKLRGRKFYWHHTDKIEKDYHEFKKSITPEKREAHNSSIQFMNYGNEFKFEVIYKGLNKDELEALVYSLELEEGMLHKIGKAKALGFGSSKITIDSIIEESKDKYLNFDFEPKLLDKTKLIESFLKADYGNSKEREELKLIMNRVNKLDFRQSPFPEETGKLGRNTLVWFMNNKRKYKDAFKLPKILDYK